MGVKTYRLLQYDSDAPNVPVIVDLPATTLAQVLAASNIVPAPDGQIITGIGVTDNATVTTKSGIVTSSVDAT